MSAEFLQNNYLVGGEGLGNYFNRRGAGISVILLWNKGGFIYHFIGNYYVKETV